MNTLILFSTAALMALVGVFCAALCVVWSIPSWRYRLGRPPVPPQLTQHEAQGLTGWSGHVGGVLISIGIAMCALVSLYGCYSVLAAF